MKRYLTKHIKNYLLIQKDHSTIVANISVHNRPVKIRNKISSDYTH